MASYFFKIILFITIFLFAGGFSVCSQEKKHENISKPLYPKKSIEKTGFYNLLWGTHYRELYALEVTATEVIDDKSTFFVPVVEGYPYFQYSPEFKELYQKEKFEGTYTDRFVADAYTSIHPLAFVIADGLARNIGLNTEKTHLFYHNSVLYRAIETEEKNYFSTEGIMSLLEENFEHRIDEKRYVRSRLLDMIIGNSLDVNMSYLWEKSNENEGVYYPYAVDRGFSFTKKDGWLYGILLNSLGIKNISNYYSKTLKVDKINAHNYVTDLALSGRIKEQTWREESAFIKSVLTENTIEKVFARLPENFQHSKSNQMLKEALIYRIANIETLAQEYYELLQKTAVIRGTIQDDTFEISQNHDTTIITVKNLQGETVFRNEYSIDKTKEIWLYGLGGIDSFSISETAKNEIIVRIINNDNFNDYALEEAFENIKVYTPQSALVAKNEVGQAVLYKTDNPDILEYSQNRPKKHTLGFQPGLLFDTDLSVRFGGKLTYTRYVFKNAPFSARHELSWNHYYSLLYSGMFPTLSEKTAYTTDVWLTSSNHFQNFFGFGNESQNYESSFGRDYNRVLLQKTGFNVGIVFNFSETQSAIIKAGVERYSITDQQKFNRDDIFQEGELQHKNNVFLNVKGNYRISSDENTTRKFNYLVEPEVGIMLNLRDMNRNVPYLSGALSLYYFPDYNRKYTIVSVVRAKALFNETYEFYQAAVMGGETGLRGFRNERFSGQQYFVHSNDFRINIGRLPNQVMPLSLETFLGIDYGRVWYAHENSQKWHTSFGGGLSFKVINKFNTNISYFTSSERPRITLSLGYFF